MYVHKQKINPDPNLKSFTKLTRKDNIPICKIENPKISKNKIYVTLDLVMSF